jgi:hypothetical protein
MRRSVPEAEQSFAGIWVRSGSTANQLSMGVDCPHENSFVHLQNSVDTAFIVPQYLVLRTLPVPRVGLRLAIGSRSQKPLQGKIVHGGSFMATKKKAKKKKH